MPQNIPIWVIGAIARQLGFDEEGAQAAMAIAQTEGGLGGAVGDQGMSFGPLQLHSRGELANLARERGMSVQQAAQWVQQNPLQSVVWGLRGYLGQAIREGQARGLRGADLATYAQTYGQRSQMPQRAGQNYESLFAEGALGLPRVGMAGLDIGEDPEGWASSVAQATGGGGSEMQAAGTPPTATYNPARRSPWSGRPEWGGGGVADVVGRATLGTERPGPIAGTKYVYDELAGKWRLYEKRQIMNSYGQVTGERWVPVESFRPEEEGAGGMTAYQLASERRQWAQFNWQQAVNSRDFEAAERWREVTDQWRQREFALATEQYLTGLEKSPTDWAALSFATRGRGAEFPRGAAPPQNIQTLAGAGRNVPDWLRGMYGTLTPEGSTFDQTGSPTGYPAPFLEHLGRIGSSLESPDVGRQWEAWRGFGAGERARPVGAMETPWYKALTGGPGLEAWRPPPGVIMPNLRARALSAPSEIQQAMGAYQGMGVPWADLMAEVQRRIPGGRAPQMRWW